MRHAVCRWQSRRIPTIALAASAIVAAVLEYPSLRLQAQTIAQTRRIDYAKDIEPILRKRCYGCHGPQQHMGNLRLDVREDLLRGGSSGPVIVPRKSAESRLVEFVLGKKSSLNPKGLMMPLTGDKLSPDEVAAVRAWIDSGAVWRLDSSAKDSKSAGAGNTSHWSFKQPARPEPPEVPEARNAIDAFVLARLKTEGTSFSAEADKGTLIRRVSLDLTGLPPTPEELNDFVRDERPNAYEVVVDRLLGSPHYGEKWARHWLDGARYADSDGHQKDLPRPYAWRYRQWVIDAMNRDMPFDEFTVEQIAGDLLPGSTTEQKVATGFHRNTMTNREGGSNPEEGRFEQVVDRTNTLGAVWLGLTVGCAQCHDHKYDPIKQEDYYQLFALFNNAKEVNIEAPLPGELGPYLATRPEYNRRRRELLNRYRVPELQADWEQKMREAASKPNYLPGYDAELANFRVFVDDGERVLKTDPAVRTENQQQAVTRFFIHFYMDVISQEVYDRLQFKKLEAELDDLDASFVRLTEAQTIAESAESKPSHIHIRGEYNRLGREVRPGLPGFLRPASSDPEISRLTFARWLVSRNNPLTARVIVNRWWQEFFGRGIVLTSENFGLMGERPSHPELLEWLAIELMDRGWSMKEMHKLMVMSVAYRQSSKSRPDMQTRDPYNILLARQNRLRLPAELIRDSALAVSGLLVPAIGGKSAVLSNVSKPVYGVPLQMAKPGSIDRYRRGLYVHFQRKSPDVQLMNFDEPSSFTTVCRRERSNTPLQALDLMNDPVFFEAAQALATRIVREAPTASFDDRVTYAFRLCLARRPAARDQERMLAYYIQEKALLQQDPAVARSSFPYDFRGVDAVEGAAWVGVSRVLLNLDQFMTRE